MPKKFLQVLMVTLLLAVPVTACAKSMTSGWEGGSTLAGGPSGGKKANTVDELAAMYDSSSCKQCHAEIYAEWEQSIHARSLIGTGSTVGGFRGALSAWAKFEHSGISKPEEATVDHMMTHCGRCHMPHLVDATDNVAQELAVAFMEGDWDTLGKVNINCLVCHSKMGSITQWRDGVPQPGEIWGTKEGSHPDPKFPKLKKNPHLQESVFCAQCHQGPFIDSPATSQCSTLYGSYLNAYIPRGGNLTCQECHTRNGDGHAMLSHWDRDYTDPENVERALDVKLRATRPFTPIDLPDTTPYSTLTVAVTNNAGHQIPDG